MSSDERPQSGLSGIARDLADDVLAKEDALLVTESSIQDVITASQEMENLPGGLQEEEVPPQEEADSLMASTVVDQTASVVLEHVSSDLAQQALSANEADGAGTTAVAEEAGGGATEEAPAVGEAKPDDAAAETTAVADAVAEAKPDDAVQTKPEEDELAGGPSEERPGSKRSASSSVDYGAQSFTSDTDLAEEAVVEDAVAAVVEDIPLVGESSTSQMLNTSVEEKEPEEIGEQSSEPLVQRRIQAESGTGTRSNSRVSQQDDVADMPAPSIHVQFLEVADPVNYDPVDEATTTAHVEAVMAAASSPTGGGVRFTFNDNEAEQNAGNGRAEEVLQGEAEGTSTEQQAVGTTTTEINATESPQETPIAEPPLVTGSDDISSTRRPTTPPKEPSMTMSVGPPESSIMGGESLAATTSTEMPPFPRFSTQHLKKVLKWTQGPEEYVQNILDVSPEQGTIYLVLVKWLIQPLPTHWRFRQGYDHFREKGEVRTLDNIDQEDLLFYNVATGECSRLHPQHDLMQLVVEVSKQENVRGVSMARSALKEWLVGQIHQWTGPFYDSKGAYWTKDNAFTRVDPRVAAQRGYQRAVRCIKLLCSHAGVNPSVILEDDEKPTPRRDFYKIEVEYQNLLSEGNKSREAQSRALQQELGVLAPDTPPKVRQKTPPPIIKPPAAKLKARERTKNVMAFFHGADTYLEVYSETNAFMRDHLEFIRAKTTAKGKSQLEAISAINKAKTCTEWFSSNVKTAGMLSQSRKLLPYDPNAVYLNRPMVSKTRTRGNGGATTLNPLGNGGTDTMRSNSLSLGAERGGKPGLSAFPEFLGDSQDTTDSKFGPLGDHNKVDNASPGEGEPMSLDNYAFVRPQGRERPPQSGPLDLGPSQLEDDPEFENAKIENRYILSENFEPVCENMLEPPVRKPRPLRDNERHAVDWSPQTRKAFEDNKASYEQYLEENAPKDVLTQAAEKDAAEKEAVDNAKNKKKAAADARRQKRGSRSPVVVPAEPSISGEVPAPSIGGQTESGASSGSGGGVESSTKLEEEDGDGNALVEAAGEDVGEDVENAANNGAAPTLALALEEVFTGEAADDDLSPVAAALVDRAVAESVPPSRGENEKPREGSSSEESATSSVSGAVVKDVIRGGLEESLGAEVERVRRTEQEKAAKNDEHTLSELLVFDAVRSGVEQVYGNDVESAHGESKTVSKAGTKESSSGGPGRPFGTEPEVAADGAAASGDAPLTSQGDRVVDTTEVLMRGDDAPKVQEDAFADVEAGDAQHKAEDEGEGAEGEMKALEEPQEEKVDEEDGEFEDEQDEDDEEEDAEPSEQEQLSSEGAEGGAGDLQPSDVTPTMPERDPSNAASDPLAEVKPKKRKKKTKEEQAEVLRMEALKSEALAMLEAERFRGAESIKEDVLELLDKYLTAEENDIVRSKFERREAVSLVDLLQASTSTMSKSTVMSTDRPKVKIVKYMRSGHNISELGEKYHRDMESFVAQQKMMRRDSFSRLMVTDYTHMEKGLHPKTGEVMSIYYPSNLREESEKMAAKHKEGLRQRERFRDMREWVSKKYLPHVYERNVMGMGAVGGRTAAYGGSLLQLSSVNTEGAHAGALGAVGGMLSAHQLGPGEEHILVSPKNAGAEGGVQQPTMVYLPSGGGYLPGLFPGQTGQRGSPFLVTEQLSDPVLAQQRKLGYNYGVAGMTSMGGTATTIAPGSGFTTTGYPAASTTAGGATSAGNTTRQTAVADGEPLQGPGGANTAPATRIDFRTTDSFKNTRRSIGIYGVPAEFLRSGNVAGEYSNFAAVRSDEEALLLRQRMGMAQTHTGLHASPHNGGISHGGSNNTTTQSFEMRRGATAEHERSDGGYLPAGHALYGAGPPGISTQSLVQDSSLHDNPSTASSAVVGAPMEDVFRQQNNGFFPGGVVPSGGFDEASSAAGSPSKARGAAAKQGAAGKNKKKKQVQLATTTGGAGGFRGARGTSGPQLAGSGSTLQRGGHQLAPLEKINEKPPANLDDMILEVETQMTVRPKRHGGGAIPPAVGSSDQRASSSGYASTVGSSNAEPMVLPSLQNGPLPASSLPVYNYNSSSSTGGDRSCSSAGGASAPVVGGARASSSGSARAKGEHEPLALNWDYNVRSGSSGSATGNTTNTDSRPRSKDSYINPSRVAASPYGKIEVLFLDQDGFAPGATTQQSAGAGAMGKPGAGRGRAGEAGGANGGKKTSTVGKSGAKGSEKDGRSNQLPPAVLRTSGATTAAGGGGGSAAASSEEERVRQELGSIYADATKHATLRDQKDKKLMAAATTRAAAASSNKLPPAPSPYSLDQMKILKKPKGSSASASSASDGEGIVGASSISASDAENGALASGDAGAAGDSITSLQSRGPLDKLEKDVRKDMKKKKKTLPPAERTAAVYKAAHQQAVPSSSPKGAAAKKRPPRPHENAQSSSAEETSCTTKKSCNMNITSSRQVDVEASKNKATEDQEYEEDEFDDEEVDEDQDPVLVSSKIDQTPLDDDPARLKLTTPGGAEEGYHAYSKPSTRMSSAAAGGLAYSSGLRSAGSSGSKRGPPSGGGPIEHFPFPTVAENEIFASPADSASPVPGSAGGPGGAHRRPNQNSRENLAAAGGGLVVVSSAGAPGAAMGGATSRSQQGPPSRGGHPPSRGGSGPYGGAGRGGRPGVESRGDSRGGRLDSRESSRRQLQMSRGESRGGPVVGGQQVVPRPESEAGIRPEAAASSRPGTGAAAEEAAQDAEEEHYSDDEFEEDDMFILQNNMPTVWGGETSLFAASDDHDVGTTRPNSSAAGSDDFASIVGGMGSRPGTVGTHMGSRPGTVGGPSPRGAASGSLFFVPEQHGSPAGGGEVSSGGGGVSAPGGHPGTTAGSGGGMSGGGVSAFQQQGGFLQMQGGPYNGSSSWLPASQEHIEERGSSKESRRLGSGSSRPATGESLTSSAAGASAGGRRRSRIVDHFPAAQQSHDTHNLMSIEHQVAQLDKETASRRGSSASSAGGDHYHGENRKKKKKSRSEHRLGSGSSPRSSRRRSSRGQAEAGEFDHQFDPESGLF